MISLNNSAEALVNAAIYASTYEDILTILGDTGVILPIGDPILSKVGASTFTTIKRSSSGIAAAFTWSEAPANFDTAPTIQGIIPVVTFNGTNEEADSPDAAYWSFGADGTVGNEPAFSVGAWVNLQTAPTAINEIIAKWRDLPASAFDAEWQFFFNGSKQLGFRLADDSSGARIGRLTGAIPTNQWFFMVATYDATRLASGIKVYVNAVRSDTTNDNSGSYVAMENTAAPVTVAQFLDSTGSPKFMLDGAIAGASLGPFLVKKTLTQSEISRLNQIGRRLLYLS